MKARELRDMITSGSNVRRLDDEIRVVLNQPGFPATPSVGVKNASFGFDWDNGRLMLRTEDPIVSKPRTKKQRKDEWVKEHRRLNKKVTKQLQVIAANMRMLAKLKRFADETNEVPLENEIEKHMNYVREALRTP